MTERNYNQEYVGPQNIQAPNSLAVGAIVTDVLMAGVLITGMVIDKHSVTISVLSGVAFFLLFGTLVILILSGTLTNVIVSRQREGTVRHMHDLQYDAQMEQLRVTVADQPRTPYELSAPPLQLPETPSFIPAVPPANEVIKVAAASFIAQLFDTSTGRPLPTRITKNKQQIQHKSPSREAIEYMKGLDMITEDGGNHLYFNLSLYPVRQYAMNSIRTGVKRVSSEEGKGRGEEGQ